MKFFRSYIFRYYSEIFIKILDFLILKLDLKVLNKLRDGIRNIQSDVIFISEGQNWSIHWDGLSVSRVLNKGFKFKMSILSKRPKYLKHKIIHWGSINTFIQGKYMASMQKSQNTS